MESNFFLETIASLVVTLSFSQNVSQKVSQVLARALGVVNVEQVAIILIIHLLLSLQLFTFLPEG